MISTITVGAGCFWGVEHLFQKLEGVVSATSGYSGGDLKNPTYQDICSGKTGHAEVVRLEYDNSLISLKDILLFFFKIHDPTSLNFQGYDIGTQYRSVIYYNNSSDKEVIDDLISELNKTRFEGKIVTEVTKETTFYKAEEYHQDYYLKKYQGADGPICHYIRNWD